jgi:hypothetical protein
MQAIRPNIGAGQCAFETLFDALHVGRNFVGKRVGQFGAPVATG